MILGIAEVFSQHTEESSFLWLLRDGAARSPHYVLNDLARLDDRLEAHLDGLRVNGEPAWQLCLEALASGEPGEAFVAAVLAFESDSKTRIERVLHAGLSSHGGARALVSALGWLSNDHAERYAQRFLTSDQPLLRRLGIAVLAIHRRASIQTVRDGTGHTEPSVQARSLRAVGEMGHAELMPLVKSFLRSDQPEVRFAAAWSATLLSGEGRALAVLRDLDQLPKARWEAALQVGLRRMEMAAARSWQDKLSCQPDQRRLAVNSAGIIGAPDSIPWLIEQMRVPLLARVAGEAFSMITGVHISYDKLEGEQPDGFEGGPTEDPKDENVEMDPDENLFWPNPDLVSKWWQRNQGQLQNGMRYLCGKPMTIDWLQQVLREGYQRQRAAAALELAIRQPATPLFNVKAPGFRQIELLGKPVPPLR